MLQVSKGAQLVRERIQIVVHYFFGDDLGPQLSQEIDQGSARRVLALTPLLGTQSHAQTGKLVDVNMAAENELQQLPSMTPAIAKGVVARRPFKTVVELNKFLLDSKLTPA